MNRKRLGVASLLLIALEGLISFAFLLTIPADPKNAVFLGFSPVRLAVAAAIGLGIFVSAAGAVALLFLPDAEKRLLDRLFSARTYPAALAISSVFLLATWVLVWMPYSRFGTWESYAERLWPVILWLALVSVQMVTLLLVFRSGLHWDELNESLSRQRTSLFVGVGVFGAALITLIVILKTGWGLDPDGMHWNSPGIPILGIQLLAAWIMGVAVMGFSSRVDAAEKKIWVDVVIFGIIWAAAAGLWYAFPAQRSYFAPGPYAPNLQVYPFSDAEVYDLGAQFALIGQKFNNFGYVDKPLYTFLLFLFHTLAGQSTGRMMLLQNLVLAFLPASVYLIGKNLVQRGAGVLAAVVVIFWNLNAYNASLYIQVTHTRLLMSELPTGLMLALFTLLLLKWLKGSGHSLAGIAAAGGLLGLTTLLRHNPWLLLPVVPVLIWIRFRRSWRIWLTGSFVFVLAFGIAILPWMVRTQRTAGTPWYFMIPIQGSVIANRYEPAFTGQETLSEPRADDGIAPLNPVSTASVTPEITVTPASTATLASTMKPEPALTAKPAAEVKTGTAQKILRAVDFVQSHFLHNLLTSILVFPSTPVNNTLVQVLRQPGSFWANWDGTLTIWDGLALIAHLLVFSLGVGTAWRKNQLAGVVPLAVFLVYNLATAAARTSGGRYIQPTQWIVFLYYGIGILQICAWAAALLGRGRGMWAEPSTDRLPEYSAGSPCPSFGAAAVVIGFGLIGLSIPLSELVISPRYSFENPTQLAEDVRSAVSQAGLDTGEIAAIQSFAGQTQTTVVKGRALYPRYYGQGRGEPSPASAYAIREYPRLVFTVIGRSGVTRVLLPTQIAPETFPDGADVLVVGCKTGGVLNAALVIYLNGSGDSEEQMIRRDPSTPWVCPLPPLVCDNNHVCR